MRRCVYRDREIRQRCGDISSGTCVTCNASYCENHDLLYKCVECESNYRCINCYKVCKICTDKIETCRVCQCETICDYVCEDCEKSMCESCFDYGPACDNCGSFSCCTHLVWHKNLLGRKNVYYCTKCNTTHTE